MELATSSVSASKNIYLGEVAEEMKRSATYLRRRFSVKPKVAVVLGSGLSSVADSVSGEPVLFSKIPGFIEPGVEGHPGQVRAGVVDGVPVLFCEGRSHYYETGSMAETVRAVRTFMTLGVEHLILTTSAGGLNPVFRPGDVMFVNDHINLMGDNPLFGTSSHYDPSPFVDVSSTYDRSIISASERICRRVRVKRQTGVLAGVRGPVYETPAERSWIQSTGADAVCMSVVPEAIAAAHLGVPVTALALIVNNASSSGDDGPLSHHLVSETGRRYAGLMEKLIRGLIRELK